jgi:hypothetical protein
MTFCVRCSLLTLDVALSARRDVDGLSLAGSISTMAQRTIIELLDDLNGGPADQTVHFRVDGVEYSIDLNDENAAALRNDLARWLQPARKLPVSGQR